MNIILSKRKYLKYQEQYEIECPLTSRGTMIQHHLRITQMYNDRPTFEKWISDKLGFIQSVNTITVKV